MTKATNRIREGSPIATAAIYIAAALIAFITLYPLWYVLVLSLSSPEKAITMRVYFWPDTLYLNGYKRIFMDKTLWLSYRNTVMYAAGETVLMLFTGCTAGYALSSPHLRHRKQINMFLLIPMYFSGGVIPMFLLILRLGLYNTPWALILMGGFSIRYTILIRSYFRTIPEALRESAYIDGANSYQILLRIFMPVAKPILAVIALYTIVGAWNSWYAASIYISSSKWQPLQLYLRRVLVEQTVDLAQELLTLEDQLADQAARLSSNQLKYTVIIVSSLPMLIIYPFFQKYFVKGVMLGSLKE